MPVDYKNGWIFALFFNQPCPIKTKQFLKTIGKQKESHSKEIWYKEKTAPTLQSPMSGHYIFSEYNMIRTLQEYETPYPDVRSTLAWQQLRLQALQPLR